MGNEVILAAPPHANDTRDQQLDTAVSYLSDPEHTRQPMGSRSEKDPDI